VVWIGGGTSAGKTSIARALAKRYGLSSYHVDQHELDRARRRDPRRPLTAVEAAVEAHFRPYLPV
jgi:uridine kinase